MTFPSLIRAGRRTARYDPKVPVGFNAIFSKKAMFVWSPVLLTSVAALCVGTSLWIFHQTLLEDNKQHLLRAVAERIASLESIGRANNWEPKATLAQFATRQQQCGRELLDTGECVIGVQDGENIRILYGPSAQRPGESLLVHDKAFAVPMRRALAGQSGTIIAKDYQGKTVLAAFTPIPQFHWGLCVKADIDSLMAAFFRSATILSLLTVGLVTLGSLLIVQLGWPVIKDLEDSRTRLQLAIDVTKHGVWDWPDISHPKVIWSPKAEEILGYQRGELSPTLTQFENILHPDDVGAVFAALDECFESHQPFDVEYRLAAKNGSYRWFRSRGQAIWDNAGRPISMSGSIEDIQLQKEAQELHQRSLKRLDALNQLREDLLAPISLDAKFKKIADMSVELLDLDFCRIWTIGSGDLCNSGCSHSAPESTHPCPRRDRCLHLAASSGQYVHTDGECRRIPLGCCNIGRIAAGENKKFLTNSVQSDPRIRDHDWAKANGMVAFAGYRLCDAKGNATGVLAAFAKHAITDEDDTFLSTLVDTASKVIIDYHVDEERRQSQKLEEIGQLAGGVAHEFNNLLQVIDGYTSAGMEGLSPEEERYECLEEVRRAAKRAASLTRQLLGFSRRTTMEFKGTDANQIVGDLVKLIRPTIGEQIAIETFLGDGVGNVLADAGELEQALLNLCLNARDAMPNGGTLTIKTERLLIEEPLWDARFNIDPGEYVVYTVSDTGTGIPRDIQSRVFEPFFTTKEVGKGTGLGLAFVYGTVRQHHGAIHLYSEYGFGTTFKLYFPPADAEPESIAIDDVVADYRGTETVLIAEDEPLVRRFAVRALQGAGYKVLTAGDGEEARQLFDEHRDEIAIVVFDAVMPRLTGRELSYYIQDKSPTTPMICCSGYAPETAGPDVMPQDKVSMLPKPFTSVALLRLVRESLDAVHSYT